MKDSLKKCKRCNNKFVYFNSEYCLECIDIIRKEKLVKSMQNNPEKYMYGFPKRFKKWDIEHILPKFKEIVNEHTKSQGLFITGQTGSGKTCLMCVLSKEMAKIGREIWFKNVSDLLFEIKGTFDKKGGIFNDYEMITNWAKKPFLVLDDIGSEKVSEYVRQSLYVLINKRYLDELPTFITSNFTLDQIAGKLDDRISSRIAEMCNVIDLGNEDLRLANKLGVKND